jgi:hypothetical protein
VTTGRLAGIGLLLPLASGAAAQAVRVRAFEDAGRRPVQGALVSLRETPLRPLAQALTDVTGSALLHAPRAGRFLIRGDRIGYRGVTAGPVSLAAGDTLEVDLVLPDERRALPPITVVSSAPVTCRLEEGASELVSILWTEARKALVGSELARTRLPMLEVTRYERGYGPDSVVLEEKVARYRSDSVSPFIAADPAQLARSGYHDRVAGGSVFFAPDARVLLSEEFLAQHCFHAIAAPHDSTLVGLAFTPARGRSRTDVAGTLWLDRESAELRHLEFEYTNLEQRFRTGRERGRVDFVRLPNGDWIVGKWRVRVAWREHGGEVALVGEDGHGPAPGAIAAGTVFDSLTGSPLAGAVVEAAGSYVDTTDGAGRFRLEIPTEGTFVVTVRHPRLHLLDLPGRRQLSAVVRGQELRADFAVPGPANLVGRACVGRPVALASESAIFGRVADSTGRARAGEVEVAWDRLTPLRAGYRHSVSERGVRIMVPTDLEGRFRVCGIPLGVEVRVAPRFAPASIHLATAEPGRVLVLELAVP